MLNHHYYIWAKLHAGHLGSAFGMLIEYLELANRNDNRLGITSALVELSWINLECCQFESALGYAQKCLETTHGLQDISPYCLGRLMLGRCYLGIYDYVNAFNCFTEIISLIRDAALIIDSPFHLFLHRGLAEYWFVQRNWEAARNAAGELCRLAALADERTYLAIGYAWLAEIAYQEGRKEAVQQSMLNAIETLSNESEEYPLAAWRVYAKAAELSDRMDRKIEAKHYRELSAASITKLADSMCDDRERRDAFLATPQAQIALGKQAANSIYVAYL
jgi:tetratricopeptide (TPR) repeat protein